MPATTVDDLTTLERIPAVDRARSRPIRTLTTAPTGYEGDGFPVHRAFAGIDLADLDPFVHMDQMGEVEYAPGEPKGTSWHPHRGFETVTYMIDGTMEHQDSEGGGGVITNGDTQWMTAGSGLLHIERPPEALVASGGLFHGIQLWVNLPSGQKMATPRYQDLRSGEVALATTPDAGALVRVIAGTVAGHRGPGSTHTPMAMVHATVAPGAELVLPWPEEFNALGYVLAGVGDIGPDRQRIEAGQTVVFGAAGERASGVASNGTAGDSVAVSAARVQDSRTDALEVLFLGGRPIQEPVAWMGPFVMNTKAELQQAYADFQSGRLGKF